MVLAHCHSQRGLVSPSGIIRTVVRRSICSGIFGLPQSRPCEKLQSVVTIRPDGAGLACALHPRRDRVPAAEPVHLEEELGVGRDDLFDRLAGERRQTHRGAARGGRPRDGDLTVRVHRLHTRRRDHHGQRNILPHNGCRQIALLGRADDMRRESELGERVDVVGDGHALLAGAQQRRVHRLGQPLLRPLLGEGDRFEPGISCHDYTGLSLHSRAGGLVSSFEHDRPTARVVDAGLGLDPLAGQRGSAVALHALGVRPVQRQAGEELGGHASAAAAVVVPAAAARAGRLRLTQLAEQRRVLPDIVKTSQSVDRMFPARNRSWMANGQA